MKYIEKQPEPEDFERWKAQKNENWQPTWGNLQQPEKLNLKESLLREQGYICCYCCQRIKAETSHIEHFQPRELFHELALDYSNLLASCPGDPKEEELKEEQYKDLKGVTQEYCGAKKDAWYDNKLMVSPLQPHCATYFRYTGDGQILPSQELSKQNAAAETIQHLGLEHPKLQRLRAKTIDGILQGIEDLSTDEIEVLLQSYGHKDKNGKYDAFVSTIAYILESFLA